MKENIYKNMLKNSSKIAASSFLRNELNFIEKTLSSIKDNTTVVVVGCHNGMYYENIKSYNLIILVLIHTLIINMTL